MDEPLLLFNRHARSLDWTIGESIYYLIYLFKKNKEKQENGLIFYRETQYIYTYVYGFFFVFETRTT